MSGTAIAYAAIPLRAPYAMSSTRVGGAWCYAMCGTGLAYGATALCGTDVGYGATRRVTARGMKGSRMSEYDKVRDQRLSSACLLHTVLLRRLNALDLGD
eukprot:3184667-Rhodomonas_salina.2